MYEQNEDIRPDSKANNAGDTVKAVGIFALALVVVIAAIAWGLFTTMDRYHDCKAAGHSGVYCIVRDIASN